MRKGIGRIPRHMKPAGWTRKGSTTVEPKLPTIDRGAVLSVTGRRLFWDAFNRTFAP